ncbi:uncharacterized protein N7479_011166 [Penicillium vulpinum]|uniref:uncharacterized protein n=1 Tax=Penicillium vulpinum TaxID=29845 RepID=UPI002548C10B|nr:uncharacterized protein N7479_011166 [Penicillium vulpinum]KAJ5952753.1 hypothetical protein N7479_011166 [Penicillium vulpinum]
MTTLTRNFSGKPGCGSPNAHHSFGTRNPTKMNYQRYEPYVPVGPRFSQGNGGARRHANNSHDNHNGNEVGNQWNTDRGGNRNGNRRKRRNNNANYNNVNGYNNANGYNNNNVNGYDNNVNGYNTNGHNANGYNNNSNGNYNGQNVNPNYKGKNYDPNYRGRNHNSNTSHAAHQPLPAAHQPVPVVNSNIDFQMAEAPAYVCPPPDEPNDIEMPDAPPLVDTVSDIREAAQGLQDALTSVFQRIQALAKGAFAIKQMVSPPLSNFQFNPVSFHEPTSHQPGFHPSAFNPPNFGHNAFDHPSFRRPVFRPATFHPPDSITLIPHLLGNPECNYFL